MTDDMLVKARANAQKNGFTNVEFRFGEIESLPVADESVDVIISNCVINLSPEKLRVFKEAYRVLKPGGRLAIADIVATAPLPDEVRGIGLLIPDAWLAHRRSVTLERMLEAVGFQRVMIAPKDTSRSFILRVASRKADRRLSGFSNNQAVKPTAARS